MPSTLHSKWRTTRRAGVQLQPPADGWYHLSPFGRFPGSVDLADGETDDQGMHQHDAEAFAAIIAAFRACAEAQRQRDPAWRGLSVDLDHLSYRLDSKTERAAFLTDLRVQGDGSDPGDGLWCKLDLTDLGDQAVTGGIYSFLSGVYELTRIGDHLYRPMALAGTLATEAGDYPDINKAAAAFTNDPGLPVRAFCRAQFAARISTTAAVATGGTKNEPATNAGKGQEMDPKQLRALLCKLLGKPETCSDQELQAAADAAQPDAQAMERLQNQCRALTAENDELKRGVEADTFIEANKDKIGDRAKFRALFVKNPTDAKAFVETVTVKKPLQQLRRDVQPPAGGSEAVPTDPNELARAQRAHITATEKATGLTGTAAFRAAKETKPELFTSPGRDQQEEK